MNTDGTTDSVIEVVRDITDRKKDEEELRQAKEAAETATRAKSDFLANMSHEIRTPMTAILGYADLMMDSRQSASERLNCLSVVRRNGEHLLGLINDILDISRIEAGKFVLDQQPCSIPSVVAEVVSMMRVRAGERGILLEAEYTGKLPETILTDQARLRQSLVNLVGNAVKFTETGGVKIIVSFLPEWQNDTPAVEIKVVDTGIGIASKDLVRLFLPFVQVDASTSRKYDGSGLGLAITHHIVTLMGGELTARSTPGEGSAFTITIPTGNLDGVSMLDQPEEVVAGQPRSGEGFSSDALSDKRILLAEDGEDNMRLIKAILNKAGAEVVVAENGRIAVDLAMREPFDVILMDMQMPKMDGYQATSYLRSGGYSGKIIALTAHAMASDRERCLSAGCDDYLTKPINRQHLVATIAEHFHTSNAGEAPPSPTGNYAQAELTAEQNSNEDIIRSCYDNDSDMIELIDKFVASLPDHIEEMRQALTNGFYEHLQRMAHQLKGTGGGYGYPMLTKTAKTLEDAAKTEDVETANITLNSLASLCCAIVHGREGARVTPEAKTDESPAD
ncbi:MAG: response regulator [Planctomycetota bacterium]|nr:response regulator [Planctomycetota bacterium]